ncbi:MAG: sigma-54-dependent Fis family transcriptional regulator [Acidobacteria bacterium]|nr:sigma-54-dependent Fis family transcriptional regulator [Acidobacteriota bacterium]
MSNIWQGNVILIIDDDPHVAEVLARLITKGMGHECRTCFNSSEALEMVKKQPFELIITDLVMPRVSGLDIAKTALAAYPDTLVIVVTGHRSLETGISALRIGVYDYILKPFKLDEVRHAVQRALERRTLLEENRNLKSQLALHEGKWEIVGKSPSMEHVYSLIQRAAPAQSTVLVTGESGTGKELVARAIHKLSQRSEAPFVSVNCGAIPDNLLESELFGHRKGAFTDADSDRTGRFVQADRGTIFLDEIGVMPLRLQVKLLRVIQEREVTPLGADKPIQVDVRIVAATNAELSEMIARGDFRDDLYYRLKVISIKLPPLRDRLDDVPRLVNHFIRKHAGRMGVEPKPFSREAIHTLQLFHWPGNVRQLENVVESCLSLSIGGEPIDVNELPDEVVQGRSSRHIPPEWTEGPIDLAAAVAQFERELIERAMDRCGSVKTKAAKLLGIKRTTLIEKLKRMEEA